MGWTDEQVTLAKKLWVDGLSAAQIAKQLAGISRNAVIGKVHRLGLSAREAPSAPVHKPLVVRGPAASRKIKSLAAKEVSAEKKPAPEPYREPENQAPGLATVLTIGKRMCKWPIGDPSTDGFTFCGEACDGPYCSAHATMAYQPPLSRKAAARDLERSSRPYF